MDLARKRAEVERLLKNSVTGEASIGRSLTRPGLCSLVQEYHFGTVYSIGLPNKGICLFFSDEISHKL